MSVNSFRKLHETTFLKRQCPKKNRILKLAKTDESCLLSKMGKKLK
jgi:hypothetical protein